MREHEILISNLQNSINLIVNKGTRNVKNKSLIIENSDVSSLFDSESDNNENKIALYKYKEENKSNENIDSESINLTPHLTKANISQSQISQTSNISDISKGSYVGSNKVFVPSLNIQKDVINKEIEAKQKLEDEKKAKRQQDKNNPRFKMQKAKNNNKRNLLAFNESKQTTLKADTQIGSPDLELRIGSSKEFTIVESGSKNSNLAGPFNPLALNLSKLPKHKNSNKEAENSIKNSLVDPQTIGIPRLNMDATKTNNEMTVTLGPGNTANFKNPNNYNTIKHKYNPEYQMIRNNKGIYQDEELHCLMI